MDRLKFARHLRQNATPAERRLWGVLRAKALGCKFRRQAPYRNYFLDFVCLEHRLVIEIDGEHHADRFADPVRDAILKADGFYVMRLSNQDVMRRLEGVRDEILMAIGVAPSPDCPA